MTYNICSKVLMTYFSQSLMGREHIAAKSSFFPTRVCLLLLAGFVFALPLEATTPKSVYPRSPKRSLAGSGAAKSKPGGGGAALPVAKSSSVDSQLKHLENGTAKAHGRQQTHPHSSQRLTRTASKQEINIRNQTQKGYHSQNRTGQGSGSRRSGTGRRVNQKR
jgi:hypothetical protein